MSDDCAIPWGEAVPLFPLPNVVLFPRAVLPLHIFEDRYRRMTADVLSTDGRLMAMALLRPGWEKEYHGPRAAIEPVVCVGRIPSHEMLSDGRYNFLLQGLARARVVREVEEEPYRQAVLEPVVEIPASKDELERARGLLTEILSHRRPARLPVAAQMREMLASEIPTEVIADLAAFNLIPAEAVALKQSLLAEADVAARLVALVSAIGELRPPPGPGPGLAGMN